MKLYAIILLLGLNQSVACAPDGRTSALVTPGSKGPLNITAGDPVGLSLPGGSAGEVESVRSAQQTQADCRRPTASETLDALPGEMVLPKGFQYPNGIALASDGTLFVGFVTSGSVLRRSANGAWCLFSSGSEEIYAGTSLRLDETRGLLWGASPDFLPGEEARPHRIFALDSRTGAVRRIMSLPEGGFGNDLALAPDGTLYVSDSRNGRVLRLRASDAGFEVMVEHQALKPVDGVGVGGIVLARDGRLVVGNFGAGQLHVVDPAQAGALRLRPLALPRRLENPDGMAFAEDGALLVLEGAIRSGDGKLLRIPSPFDEGQRSIEIIRAGLPSPVNLTMGPDGVAYVTISRIRHRLLVGRERDTPRTFGVLPIDANRR